MKIQIIGAQSREKYYKHDPKVETWGLNGIRYSWVKKWDRMFNIHMRKHLEEEWTEGLMRDIEWANENKDCKFYVCDKWPDVKHAKIFPRKKMKNFPRPDYHCGSFDWLIHFAIYEGVKEIELHGINLMLERGEPVSARTCLEYWCGYAEAKGIKITLAKDCSLFQPYFIYMGTCPEVYGYDNYREMDKEFKWVKRIY